MLRIRNILICEVFAEVFTCSKGIMLSSDRLRGPTRKQGAVTHLDSYPQFPRSPLARDAWDLNPPPLLARKLEKKNACIFRVSLLKQARLKMIIYALIASPQSFNWKSFLK